MPRNARSISFYLNFSGLLQFCRLLETCSTTLFIVEKQLFSVVMLTTATTCRKIGIFKWVSMSNIPVCSLYSSMHDCLLCFVISYNRVDYFYEMDINWNSCKLTIKFDNACRYSSPRIIITNIIASTTS